MHEWTFYKNRCHPGVANGAIFLKGRQGRRTWASEPLRVRTVWKTIQYRGEGRRGEGGRERARGEALERGACVHTYTRTCTRLKEFTQRVYTTRPALANAATCVAHESAWKKEGCGQEDDGRESRWRRSLVQPSSILHKARWEISINRFRRGLSIGAAREPRIRRGLRSVRNAASKASRPKVIVILKQTKWPSP